MIIKSLHVKFFRQELQKEEPESCWDFICLIYLLVLPKLVGVKALENGSMVLFDSKFQNNKFLLCFSKIKLPKKMP